MIVAQIEELWILQVFLRGKRDSFQFQHLYSLSKVQDQNKDVEIGSYPFFHAGKLGVSIVLRSEQQSKIDNCSAQILNFIKEKKIEIVDR